MVSPGFVDHHDVLLNKSIIRSSQQAAGLAFYDSSHFLFG